ncbi:MAG: glycosyltransferase family 4 protein [Anaerolineae bacterium]
MIHRPLRFCMITTFYPPYSFGGDGIFAHQLSNELAKRGHQVDVIHCIDSYLVLAGREPMGPYSNRPNVKVHGLRSRFGPLSPLATQQTGYPLLKSRRIREILETGFDVIHYHNVSLVGGPRILEYGEGIKLYTMHECWLVCPTHVLFRYRKAPCVQRRCLVCQLAYGRPPQWWRYTGLLERALANVDAFIAPSRFSKAVHEERGLGMPIVHLPNFVPTIAPAGARDGDQARGTEDGPCFLFVGRLEKLKGLQTLIPVFKRYPKARLLIAGSGSYEAHLQRLAEGQVNIRFLGKLSEKELRSAYRHAVALIVPSIGFEMFPLVIVEAFRQQTPVIVRNLGGMPEIVEESGGGFVYDTDEQLVAAMDRLLIEPALRDKLGRRGYQTYLQKWTTEAHLKRYLGLIRQIAASDGQWSKRA